MKNESDCGKENQIGTILQDGVLTFDKMSFLKLKFILAQITASMIVYLHAR